MTPTPSAAVDLPPTMADVFPSAQAARVAAERCIGCHDAPCVTACPTGIDVPRFIRQIAEDNLEGAAETILSANILGRSCGTVCPTAQLCEGACVFLDTGEAPIEIGRLQTHATTPSMANHWRFFAAPKGTSLGRVAVIGGGPAGLACAHELTRLGVQATVFEAGPELGGLNVTGVASPKLSPAMARAEAAYVAGIGFEVRLNTPVTAAQAATLLNTYDAVFLAVGKGQAVVPGGWSDVPLTVATADPQASAGVFTALDWISAWKPVEAAQPLAEADVSVTVVGAGNTAMDAAGLALRLGAQEVTVVARGAWRAYPKELAAVANAGGRLVTAVQDLSIIATPPQGVVLRGQRTGQPWQVTSRWVVLATGQMVGDDSLIRTWELATDDKGNLVVDANGQTSHPRVFAGGDCVAGGREVVHAVAHGRDAARAIVAQLAAPNVQP